MRYNERRIVNNLLENVSLTEVVTYVAAGDTRFTLFVSKSVTCLKFHVTFDILLGLCRRDTFSMWQSAISVLFLWNQ